MRFGNFLGPFHHPRQNPTLSLELDLQLVEHMDRLGFDEVWFGEHHSGSYEIIPSPEIMIAAAAQRTRRIRLCSGVISLPYHHPLMVADRMVMLDHLTRGRVIFGVGPGALVTDSYMMGLDYNSLRPRMEESLGAILALLGSSEPVNRETDWFVLEDARLQLNSYTVPRPKIYTAQARSPAGPLVAGKYGVGLISFGTTSKAGIEAAAGTWGIVSEQAERHGQVVDRDEWALVAFMHIRETERQARDDLRWGARDFFSYNHIVTPPEYHRFSSPDVSVDEIADTMNGAGTAVIGTPEMAVEFLKDLEERTGGFGSFLFYENQWASPEATMRKYELFAREVMPHFDGSYEFRSGALEWTRERHGVIAERMRGGWEAARADYEQKEAARVVQSAGEPDATAANAS